ncbi:PepSY-associated TM helix domain-containing protein [Vibrio tritonius]|uniref:PepSY-associated TM helix domain-containing protein n=1 Tax=Vibrio tritonius TaxID=1435069 RepID=UPI0009EB242E|nr:PepSY-associated TM helix domain-containing protein [Vibrio tritonius]
MPSEEASSTQPATMKKNSHLNQGVTSFVRRLHFYIGLFVGPFIFMAALTGTLYVMTPQLEQWVYHDELTTTNQGQPQPLSLQIAAARQALTKPLVIKSVRPAPTPGQTTRVLFRDPTLHHYQVRTLFVDPVTLAIHGDLASYGTSGILPLRIAIDFMHTDLLLGPVGRNYSELAASWMWVAALGGLYLWWNQRRAMRRESKKGSWAYHRSRHSQVGVWIAVGLLFFSATGLTWSKWAGSNIAQWRQTIGWVTPSVSRHLPSNNPHYLYQDKQFDGVLASARTFGLSAGKIEIVPAYQAGKAWMVHEIDRAWPTQVDAVSIDPISNKVVSHVYFADYPLVAKLIRWGIDAHMGVLFGLPNQIVLALFGLALCIMIVWGYRMWWIRRPKAGDMMEPLTGAWLKLSKLGQIVVFIVATVLGWSLPVMGVSLVAFIAVDVLRWRWYKPATLEPVR